MERRQGVKDCLLIRGVSSSLFGNAMTLVFEAVPAAVSGDKNRSGVMKTEILSAAGERRALLRCKYCY